ncbi:MAG: O-antigen ligase family protein, partial [Butyrivibrio sp.]|nr:O-antigen ligase family protein [Butyrivibrio sp.]
NILTSICSAHIGLILVAAALFLYRLVRLFEEIKGKWHGKAYTIGAFVLVAATVIAGIIYLAGSVDLEFGNSRGLIWSICLDLFKGLNPIQKLVGIGQDGIYSYAYRDPEMTTSLMNVFGFNQLTNAHCEPLTILIERGIIGLVSYLALVACAFITFWKNKKENTVLFCVLPIAAYFAFGLVSFSLPVSTPYLWLFLGLGQGYCRPVHGKTNES